MAKDCDGLLIAGVTIQARLKIWGAGCSKKKLLGARHPSERQETPAPPHGSGNMGTRRQNVKRVG